MKRKKIIPLLLALSLSSSVFSFGPTWGEPANESWNSVLTGEDGEETDSSIASSNMDFTHYSPLEVRASDSDLPGGEEVEDLFAFEKRNNKEDFDHCFDDILDPIPVSINLDNDKYYEVKDGRAYYLELSGNANSNPILAKLAKTIREKIDPSPSLDDDMVLGGLLPSYGVMAGGSPFAIRFKKFESREKLAYLVWQGLDEVTGKPKKYLIPLEGTSLETFNFIVSGNVNQFNLPKNKEICNHNMGEIISFLKENYPEIGDSFYG